MDFTKIISTVAPWIGASLNGPLSGMGVAAATAALNLDDRSIDSLKQAMLQVRPEQMLSLRAADQEFAIHMQSLGFKKIEAIDNISTSEGPSARGMQISKPSFVPAMLTCFVVGVFTTTLILLLKFDVPATNRDIVVYMIGQLSGGFTSALAFWLGTTRDSSRKTELLAQSSPI